MLGEIAAGLQLYPEVALFIVLALGHVLGAIRFGAIQLGGVCGTLLIALAVGQLGIHVADGVKNMFFMLFTFALGYAGGPQFFASLNAKGLRLGVLCLVEVVSVVALVLAATYFLALDPGTAAGLLAGAATESAVVGTAADAISRLQLPTESIKKLQANVVTAYSVTYIFGLISIVIATSQIFPLLLRINLRDEASRLWRALGGDEQESSSATPEMVGRVFRVVSGGRTIGELMSPLARRAYIARLTRGGALLPVDLTQVLQEADEVLVIGRRAAVLELGGSLGRELADSRELHLVVETSQVVLTREKWFGQELPVIEAAFPGDAQVLGVARNGQPLPLLPGLNLQRGDVLHLYALSTSMRQVQSVVGEPVVHSARSNMSLMAFGVVLGVFGGGFSLNVAGVSLSLGTGGGSLLTGLVFGWYQASQPHRPSIPPAALALMKDLGLSVFIACVGLTSGPQALVLVERFGVTLPLVGVAIALVPATISLFVGHKVLKLEAPVLLGAIAGQQCSTPALSAVQGVAGNSTPLLGYTITYAISNVTLPLLGPLIVALAATSTAVK